MPQPDSSIIRRVRREIALLEDRPVVVASIIVVAVLDALCIGARKTNYELLGRVESAVEFLKFLALSCIYTTSSALATTDVLWISYTHANSQSAEHIC